MRVYNVDVEYAEGPIENVFVKAQSMTEALTIVSDLYKDKPCLSVSVDDVGSLVN